MESKAGSIPTAPCFYLKPYSSITCSFFGTGTGATSLGLGKAGADGFWIAAGGLALEGLKEGAVFPESLKSNLGAGVVAVEDSFASSETCSRREQEILAEKLYLMSK